MTKQEIFDFVVAALREQGEPSMEDHTGLARCMYRGPRGLKCAVGHLIPDELYDPNIEGHSVDEIQAMPLKNFKKRSI